MAFPVIAQTSSLFYWWIIEEARSIVFPVSHSDQGLALTLFVTGILHVIFTLQVGYTPANFPLFFSFAPGIQNMCSKCLIDLTWIPSGMSREGDLERLMGFSLLPLWRWYVSVGKPRLKELVFSSYGGCSSGVNKMTLME